MINSINSFGVANYLISCCLVKQELIDIYQELNRNIRQVNTQEMAFSKSKNRSSEGVATQSFTQAVKGTFTNFWYKASGSVSAIMSKKAENQSSQILGIKHANQKQTMQAIRNVLWFSYRSKYHINQQYHSDVGWGCVLRVGQMLLAEAIKRYLSENQKRKLSKQQISSIIKAFIDQDSKQQKYSIYRITGFGQKQMKKKPGQWYQLGQMGRILEILQNRERPMLSTNGLRITYFGDCVLYLGDVYQMMRIGVCACLKKRVYCEKCHRQVNQDINILILIITRLGISQPGEQQYQGLLEFLDLRQSLGAIGGFPKKALYFIGHENNQLIYLDPHYVQEAPTSQNLQKYIKTFTCEQKRKASRKNIDPSIGLAFFIRNLHDLEELITKMNKLKKQGKSTVDYVWSESSANHFTDLQTTIENKSNSKVSTYQVLC